MNISMILIWSLLLFSIIYFAVRLAITPLLDDDLLNKEDESFSPDKNLGLTKLRDIEVFTNEELEEIIELYQNKDAEKKQSEEYQKYENVLTNLKNIGYLSDEEYSNKINKLKQHLNKYHY